MIQKLFTVSLLAFASVAFAQSELPKVTEQSIKDDLARVVCKDKERGESVKQLFISKGAKPDDIVISGTKKVENIVVTKQGKTSEIVVIGAHYDKVPEGCGAIDNWTGIVVLANIYAAFSAVETEKTLVFAAFGREEEGLIGSREMVKGIAKENRPQYCSMVNLDSFGHGSGVLGALRGLWHAHVGWLWETHGEARSSKYAKELAEEVKMPFSQASLAGTADADSSPFLDAGIPAITFHGLSSKWAEIIHSPSDKLEKVNARLVYVAFQFAALYVNRIDPKPCSLFRK